MRGTAIFVVTSILLAACGGSATPRAHTPNETQRGSTRAASVSSPAPSAQPVANLRELPADATFADIVDAARKLDDASLTQSTTQCLLSGGEHARLQADLLPGVRPLPPVQTEIADIVEPETGTPTVLSAWGRLAGTSQVSIVPFTTTSTAAHSSRALALFVTSRGIYVRSAEPITQAHPGPMTLDAVSLLLTQLPASQSFALYLSADGSTSLSRLREVLRALPDRIEVALAITLPKGTRLPADAPASSDFSCPDGLPEPSAGAAEGDLDPQVLRDALAPLRQAALSCALSTGGRAWLGGRLVLSLRIGADGRVQESCLSEDAVGEPMLRRCLTESARVLAFPSPKPAGFVDVALPLQLDITGPSRQRALCD